MQSNPHEVVLNWTSEKLENLEKVKSLVQIEGEGDLVATFDQLSSCWPSWISAISKSHKNCYYHPTIKDRSRDLKTKPNTTKIGWIIKLNKLSAILDWQPLPKITSRWKNSQIPGPKTGFKPNEALIKFKAR